MNSKSLTLILCLASSLCFAQSKSDLKKEIEALKSQKQLAEKSRDSVMRVYAKIGSVAIDSIISAHEYKAKYVGDGGWRTDLNGDKVVSNIPAQLGSIWYMDSTNTLYPYGGIKLSETKLQSIISANRPEILYNKFISKGTKIDGGGNYAIVSAQASLNDSEYSNLTVTRKEDYIFFPDQVLLDSAVKHVKVLRNQSGIKSIFLCTGMYVEQFLSEVYKSTEGETKVTTPVINVAGTFYSESKEKQINYYVARQLTQLYFESKEKTDKIVKDIETTIAGSTVVDSAAIVKKYSAQELLTFILHRKPSQEEMLKFQNDPTLLERTAAAHAQLTDKEKAMIEIANAELSNIPENVNFEIK